MSPAPEFEANFLVGERRQLTVLFCDLVGSTQFSQQIDAEEWRYILSQYHQAASSAVARFGGYVAKNLGDGLLVYFGWPTAREDDPERAVRAGLAILDAMPKLNARITVGAGDQLSVRVGMHTGLVVIADGGEVFGDTPNIAARVQSTAEPDTVVITAATQRLVAGMFVVEDRGVPVLKGLREAMALYRVVRPSGVRSRLQLKAGRLSPFIGRDVEFATLIDRWERAEDGEGQNVLVLGEAGVGKSRLIWQLHVELAAVPHTWLECGATPYTEGTPFYPIASLVAQGLGFAPEDTKDELLSKVEQGLRGLASTENVALLADFLGLPPPTALQLSRELRRRKTMDLLAKWYLALSEAQPLVMLVEDLHWSDASTLELLGDLIAQSPTARVLLLATARPEFVAPWPSRSNLTTMQLPRLTKRQTRDMISALGGPELPTDTLHALVARADGVPLYIEELTRAVTDPGMARGVDAIPATLADSLMARLDRLSAAKEVAQRAAVLGREFGYPLLEATAGLDGAILQQGLDRLVDAEILFARGEMPATTYTFKHTLIQETAYQSLLKRTRQQFHARVAQVLEERFPDRVVAEPEVIARHYDQAGLASLASTHYQRAGEGATQRSANEEAIAHLRRALAVVATMPETRERHQRELALQMAIGVPIGAALGWSCPEYGQAYARARELAARIGEWPELPQVLVGMAVAYLIKGDLATAADVAQEALIAAERTGDRFHLLSAHMLCGQALLFQGNFVRALEHFEQTVSLYDPDKHSPLAYTVAADSGVNALAHAAWCHIYLGYPGRARTVCEEAVLLARRVEHPISLALALGFAGFVYIQRGEMELVRERASELLELAEQLGFPLWLGLGKLLRGVAETETGEVEVGVARVQEAIVELAGIGNGIGVPQIFYFLAKGLSTLGRCEEAVDAIGVGLAQAEFQGQHYYDADLYRLRTEIALRRAPEAERPDAEALFGRSLELAREQGAKTLELRAATSLARFRQGEGKASAARDLLAPLYGWFTDDLESPDLATAKALLDQLAS